MMRPTWLVRARRVGRNTALGLLPLLLLFMTAEITQRVRYSIRQHNPRWLYYGFLWAAPTADVPRIPVRVRKDDYLGRFDPNNVNILCIGVSSTYRVFNDRRYTYPNLLSELLNQEASAPADIRYSVLNRGVPAGTSEFYQATIDRELATYTPDAVIIYTGFNDMFGRDVNLIYQTFSEGLFTAWQVLERYSLLALTAKEKYLFWIYSQPPEGREERERLEYFEREFKSALALVVEQLVGRGVKVILIPEVLMAKDFGGLTRNYESYGDRYRNVPGIVSDIAKQYGAEFVDVQQDFEARDFRAMFKDPVHLTDEGNRVLSQLIVKYSTTLKALRGRSQGAADGRRGRLLPQDATRGFRPRPRREGLRDVAIPAP